jgi:putative phage-type endonuclease
MSFTAQQLEDRRHGIGASEIAALVGLSPWMSPFDLWADKLGRAPRADTNLAMSIGTHLEPGILSLYGAFVGPVRPNAQTVRHPTHSWATATPDGYCTDASGRDATPLRLVECKVVSFSTAYHWSTDGDDEDGDDEEGDDEDVPRASGPGRVRSYGQDGVPLHYLVQVQWQMFVTGAVEVDVAALLGLEEFRHYRVRRDEEAIQNLAAVAERFWTHNVLGDNAPPITPSPRTSDVLRAMYPRNKTPLMPWTDAAKQRVEWLVEAKRSIAEQKKLVQATENELKQMIGEAEGIGEHGRGKQRVTWRLDKQGKVNWKAVAEAMGPLEDAVVEAHRRPPTRRLLVSGFQRNEEE